MPKTRLYDRSKSRQHSTDQGQTVVVFDSAGAASHDFLTQGAGGADSLASLLRRQDSVYELGRPGLAIAISADASVEEEITVPAGKYWRVIGGFLQYTASADAATRTPIVTLEDDGGVAYATVSMSTKTANQVENDHFLAGSDGAVAGTQGVAAQGTLTIAEPVTNGDTFTIGSKTYTFVTTDDGTVTNAIAMGANEAATKAALEAMFVDGVDPLVNAVAFAGDDMVFTARTKGVAGDSIVFVEGTLTHASNVLDGSGTLGGTTAGVDEADDILSIDYPTAGVLLGPGEVIALNVTNGHANDALELAIFYIEFDNDPTL